MRIRCKNCGQTSDQNSEYARCPECGEQLSIQSMNNGKGQLPTQNASVRNVGCLIIGILLFGVPFTIAIIAGEDGAAYWVYVIAAIILLIPLGVWFERRTVKRRQK